MATSSSRIHTCLMAPLKSEVRWFHLSTQTLGVSIDFFHLKQGVGLYNGTTGALIATVSFNPTSNNNFGSGFLIALANGNFAVSSPFYNELPKTKLGLVSTHSPTTGAVSDLH